MSASVTLQQLTVCYGSHGPFGSMIYPLKRVIFNRKPAQSWNAFKFKFFGFKEKLVGMTIPIYRNSCFHHGTSVPPKKTHCLIHIVDGEGKAQLVFLCKMGLMVEASSELPRVEPQLIESTLLELGAYEHR